MPPSTSHLPFDTLQSCPPVLARGTTRGFDVCSVEVDLNLRLDVDLELDVDLNLDLDLDLDMDLELQLILNDFHCVSIDFE